MLIDCPGCGFKAVATIRDGDVECTNCREDVKAGNVLTPDERLTPREWEALGKQGDHPSVETAEE